MNSPSSTSRRPHRKRSSQRIAHPRMPFLSWDPALPPPGQRLLPLTVPIVFPGRATGKASACSDPGRREALPPSSRLLTPQERPRGCPEAASTRWAPFSTTDSAPPAARSGWIRRGSKLCLRHGLALQPHGAALLLWPPVSVLG
jgi:hypothetical protein